MTNIPSECPLFHIPKLEERVKDISAGEVKSQLEPWIKASVYCGAFILGSGTIVAAMIVWAINLWGNKVDHFTEAVQGLSTAVAVIQEQQENTREMQTEQNKRLLILEKSQM